MSQKQEYIGINLREDQKKEIELFGAKWVTPAVTYLGVKLGNNLGNKLYYYSSSLSNLFGLN